MTKNFSLRKKKGYRRKNTKKRGRNEEGKEEIKCRRTHLKRKLYRTNHNRLARLKDLTKDSSQKLLRVNKKESYNVNS